jgi:hypothetical protein
LKVLVVIGLVVLLFVLLYRRLRPHLRVLGEFIKTVRRLQQMGTSDAPRENQNRKGEKLVHCETCGTWIPVGRALREGSAGSFFCSKDCLSGVVAKKRKTGISS